MSLFVNLLFSHIVIFTLVICFANLVSLGIGLWIIWLIFKNGQQACGVEIAHGGLRHVELIIIKVSILID